MKIICPGCRKPKQAMKMDRCPSCYAKNVWKADYCPSCRYNHAPCYVLPKGGMRVPIEIETEIEVGIQ